MIIMLLRYLYKIDFRVRNIKNITFIEKLGWQRVKIYRSQEVEDNVDFDFWFLCFTFWYPSLRCDWGNIDESPYNKSEDGSDFSPLFPAKDVYTHIYSYSDWDVIHSDMYLYPKQNWFHYSISNRSMIKSSSKKKIKVISIQAVSRWV